MHAEIPNGHSGIMRRFRRVHESGTNALIIRRPNGWRIQINLREPSRHPGIITGYLVQTFDQAKLLADKEVSKQGHVCNGSCQGWFQV